MNYFDILLAKKLRGGGGGDITIKSLNVTQNGTYSEEGVAYSPVKVNVPLPENAYLLKDIPNTPTAIATFTDGSDLPMPKLEVGIEPVQEGSGDPSPTNIRPISGWDEVNVGVSGVNVWDEEWESGNYNPSTGEKTPNPNTIRCKNLIPCKPNTTYYNKVGTTTNVNVFYIVYYDAEKNYVGNNLDGYINRTFTTPNNACFMSFFIGNSSYPCTTYNNDISINYPSTDTSYHAYNGQTYTIDLDGTRYGGKLDVVSGVLTVERASIKLNDLNWIKQNTTSGNWRFMSSQSIQNVKLPTDASWKIDNLCSVYQNVTANETWTAEKTGIAINADGKLLICDLNQADTTALGVVIANQTYCYELATPLTIQLSPTVVKSLRGVNNVCADSGDILDLSYLAKEE